MKFLLLIFTSVLFLSNAKSLRFDKCLAFGAIYFTNDKNSADFIVYIEESEVMGDLKIYKASSPLYATKSGLWFETLNKSQANFLVYIEKEKKSLADFTISYTEHELSAGCDE